MKTHRCKGSLKEKISIHYCRFMDGYNEDEDFNKLTWRLFCYRFDYDYDVYHKIHISEIEFCPYCGEKLY